jgi:hypothetical protein
MDNDLTRFFSRLLLPAGSAPTRISLSLQVPDPLPQPGPFFPAEREAALPQLEQATVS